MIGGQVVDIFSTGEEVDEVTLEYIHRNKTGALYRISVRTGAILAGARQDQLEALSRYAEHLGLAFQIKDDILDLVGEEKIIGKPVGSDLKNKKATYPAFSAWKTPGKRLAGNVPGRFPPSVVLEKKLIF